MSTINDSRMKLERMLAVVLPAYLPQAEGCSVEVDIIEDGLKMHRGAESESWRPYNGGEIRIRFDESPAVAAVPDLEEDPEYPVEEDFDDGGNAWQQKPVRPDPFSSAGRTTRRVRVRVPQVVPGPVPTGRAVCLVRFAGGPEQRNRRRNRRRRHIDLQGAEYEVAGVPGNGHPAKP